MFLRLVTLAALVFAPFQAQAPATKADAPVKLPEARTIIDRHIKAVGGRDAILARKSMHGVGTVSIPAAGITGPIEVFGAAPNKILVKSSIPGMGEFTEGFDGTHGWSMNPMTGPVLKADKELEQAKLDAEFYGELRDPKLYTEIKTVDKVTFDGRDCYKVSLKRIDGVEDVDYYDVATGLRAGGQNTRITPMGPVPITSIASNYQKIGKLTQAMQMTQQMMGQEQKITLTSIEYDKVDPSVFELPAAIKALIK